MKKRIVVPVVIAMTLIAVSLGPWSYRRWRISSAIAKLKSANAAAGAQRQAGTELVQLGHAAIRPLTALLKHQDREVRGRAADTLQIMKELVPEETIDELIPILTEQLQQGDFATRRKAADSLQMMRRPLPKETIYALMQAANNAEERKIRYQTGSKPYSALVNSGRPAVPALIRSLKSDNDDIRLQAMQALSRIGPEAEEAVPALINVLKNRELTKTESKLDQADWMISSDAGVALASIGRHAIPALADALRDEREYVRFDAASALSRIGEPAVHALIEALRDEQVAVRLEAARALERIGPPAKRAVPSLIVALHDDNSPPHLVPMYAARALGQIGKEQAIPALVEMLEEEDVHVRTHAAEALHILGWENEERLLAVLIEALNHDIAGVCAARTLQRMGTRAKGALAKLRELSKTDGIDLHFREAVSQALKNIDAAANEH